MHSGQVKKVVTLFKAVLSICLLLSMSLVVSCRDEKPSSGIGFKTPYNEQMFSLGEDVKIELDLPKGATITTATYLVDGKLIETKNDGKSIVFKTNGLAVGTRQITAIVDYGSSKDTAKIEIVMKSNVVPEQYGYKVINTFPHDTTSYTQGLEYHNGKFLESTGEEGKSTLRWVDLASGKALQRIDLDQKYFGEGSTLVGEKVVMLTYKHNLGFVYDARTFKQLASFPYPTSREGWGLCYDGKQLIMSDGSNRLYFMNKDTYVDESVIDVFDNNGPVNAINELEYIDGKLYANIYTQNYIVVIDPKSGIVEKKINLSGIFNSDGYFKTEDEKLEDVLNGIAWDKDGKRLFVTGKKWPRLFEIELVRK